MTGRDRKIKERSAKGRHGEVKEEDRGKAKEGRSEDRKRGTEWVSSAIKSGAKDLESCILSNLGAGAEERRSIGLTNSRLPRTS